MIAITVLEKLIGFHKFLNKTLKCSSFQSSIHEEHFGESNVEAENMSNETREDLGKEVENSGCFEKNYSFRLDTVEHISQLQHVCIYV